MNDQVIHKMQAINKYKKQQILNNFVLYSLTTLACSLFCSSPFWYPPLRAIFNVFLSVSLPKIISLFISSKFVFIVGNIIVIFLVGEFKICTVPQSSPVYEDVYRARSESIQKLETSSEEKATNNYQGRGQKKIDLEVQHLGKEMAGFRDVKDCASQNRDTLFVGTHKYRKAKVALESKVPSGLVSRHKDTSHTKEGDWREEKVKNSNGKESSLPAKDLNKMADDFIARVNKQRRLEACIM